LELNEFGGIMMKKFMLCMPLLFFEGSRGEEVGLSHLFYVKLHSLQDAEQLEVLAKQHQVKILYNNKFRPLWYTLACDRNSTGNALALANLFYETGFFAAAEPDLMPTALFQTVDDPFYNDQWNLNNTGQYGGTSGEDIQVTDAWKITRSHSAIVIAINDEGVELDHPDLPNMHPDSYDTGTKSSPSQTQGPHGTAVAGIAGANSDNNEGIAGIAPQGQILSISTLFFGSGTSDRLADAIDYAWQNGAHVINNSWGGGLPNGNINDAIDNAVTQGRGGLGTVVVFSTGNSNLNSIGYPSYRQGVIAVGATSMCSERTSYTSCDTEFLWGSNYGTGLDVMAPGVLIPTTDMQWINGYNPYIPLHIEFGGSLLTEDDEYDNEDYTIWFMGTSAAAPHVSGIASLILSINNNLTVQEVRDAIESTAEKIGEYIYTMGAGERQDLTWNDEMGYGRVNAYKALIYTIENHGAHLGTELSQVRLPLYDNLILNEDVTLESGSNLTIESESGTVTIAAASGTVTIGGQASGGGSNIIAGDEPGRTTETIQTVPERFMLSNNYPNPFNPSTVIEYTLPEPVQVKLEIFDILGRRVAVLVNDIQQPGRYKVNWDATNASSGMYLYRIQAGAYVETRRMLLMK
jgi:subtilisin family serine protease